MTIEEAEAAVKAAKAALTDAQDAANRMLTPFEEKVTAAEKSLLAALVAAHPIQVGDIFERKTWNKTERIKVTGFRHIYGRDLAVIGSPLKKDGTPSLVSREYYNSDNLRKVEP